ncbi:MAG: FKBP-type peptidyl-prolyl cis-trans isomerase SlyD [Anaerolineales bacterium]|nr:FKBP-type peptidyl-prolyl cis-trans isomerase SlyD [Anaerolineales bacterium]
MDSQIAGATVADDMVVSLEYTLRLEDGEIVDTSEGRDPLAYIQGQGNIIPGLEKAVAGMAVGDEKDVVVEPANGYGEADPDAYQEVPRNAFPSEMELTRGMGLSMRDRDTGEALEAYVAGIREDSVLLDFNHPLAGETLHFRVKVADLRSASDEELSHGHVHTEEGVD